MKKLSTQIFALLLIPCLAGDALIPAGAATFGRGEAALIVEPSFAAGLQSAPSFGGQRSEKIQYQAIPPAGAAAFTAFPAPIQPAATIKKMAKMAHSDQELQEAIKAPVISIAAIAAPARKAMTPEESCAFLRERGFAYQINPDSLRMRDFADQQTSLHIASADSDLPAAEALMGLHVDVFDKNPIYAAIKLEEWRGSGILDEIQRRGGSVSYWRSREAYFASYGMKRYDHITAIDLVCDSADYENIFKFIRYSFKRIGTILMSVNPDSQGTMMGEMRAIHAGVIIQEVHRPEFDNWEQLFLFNFPPAAPSDPMKGGPSGGSTQIAVQGGAIETFISDVVPAVCGIFGRREPRIGPPLQNIKPDDSMKPANPPPAGQGVKGMVSGEGEGTIRDERLKQARRLVDPMLNLPATDQELGNLLDIPLAKLSTDGVLRIFAKKRFVNGQPNQVSLGMKGLWSRWNTPVPAPVRPAETIPGLDITGKRRMAQLGDIILANVVDSESVSQSVPYSVLSEFCQLAQSDPEYIEMLHFRSGLEPDLVLKTINFMPLGVATQGSPRIREAERELARLMARVAHDRMDPVAGTILAHHVEGEFKLNEIVRAFMQFVRDRPERIEELVQQALGRAVETPIFDFTDTQGTRGGLLYYVFQLIISKLDREPLGSVALGAARTPEMIATTADDFNNRAYLYSVDPRYVPRPFGGGIATPPGGRAVGLFLTEWLDGFQGVRARLVDGQPELGLRTSGEDDVPLTLEQRQRLWRGIGHLFGVYAINPRHASIGSLKFERSDVALSVAPEAVVAAKLTACPILQNQDSQEAAIRENFKTALFADIEVTYRNSQDEEKQGRALLSDSLMLLQGFYKGLLEKWVQETPADSVGHQRFIQIKVQKMLMDVVSEAESGLETMDEYRRHELTQRVLPFLKLYSDPEYWTDDGPLNFSHARGDSSDLATEVDLEAVLALRARRLAQGLPDDLVGMPDEFLSHLIRGYFAIRPRGSFGTVAEIPFLFVLRLEGRVVGYALSRWMPIVHAGIMGQPVLEPGLENTIQIRRLMEIQIHHLRTRPGVSQIIFSGDPRFGATEQAALELGFQLTPARVPEERMRVYLLNCVNTPLVAPDKKVEAPMTAEEVVHYLQEKKLWLPQRPGFGEKQVTLEGLRLRDLLPGQKSLHLASGRSLLPVAEALMGLDVTAYDLNRTDVYDLNELLDQTGIRQEIERRGGKFRYEKANIAALNLRGPYDHISVIDLNPYSVPRDVHVDEVHDDIEGTRYQFASAEEPQIRLILDRLSLLFEPLYEESLGYVIEYARIASQMAQWIAPQGTLLCGGVGLSSRWINTLVGQALRNRGLDYTLTSAADIYSRESLYMWKVSPKSSASAMTPEDLDRGSLQNNIAYVKALARGETPEAARRIGMRRLPIELAVLAAIGLAVVWLVPGLHLIPLHVALLGHPLALDWPKTIAILVGLVGFTRWHTMLEAQDPRGPPAHPVRRFFTRLLAFSPYLIYSISGIPWWLAVVIPLFIHDGYDVWQMNSLYSRIRRREGAQILSANGPLIVHSAVSDAIRRAAGQFERSLYGIRPPSKQQQFLEEINWAQGMRARNDVIETKGPPQVRRAWQALLGVLRPWAPVDSSAGGDMVDSVARALESRRQSLSHQLRLALERIPRERFLPSDASGQAMQDTAVEISHGQFQTQPTLTSWMIQEAIPLESLQRQEPLNVLIVGTGSGYSTALAADYLYNARPHALDQIHSVEAVPDLYREAVSRLEYLPAHDRIRVHQATPALGWPSRGPYDCILIFAGTDNVYALDDLTQQLKIGGRLIIPWNDPWVGGSVICYKRLESEHGRLVIAEENRLTGANFVPLQYPLSVSPAPTAPAGLIGPGQSVALDWPDAQDVHALMRRQTGKDPKDLTQEALRRAFLQVRLEVGDIQKIRNTNPWKFARLIGAINFASSDLFTVPELFYLTPDQWREAEAVRTGRMPGANVSRFIRAIAAIPRIAGPGIYFDGREMQTHRYQDIEGPTSAADFFHELMEKYCWEVGLADPIMVAEGHLHMVVLEGHLRFASLLGNEILQVVRSHLHAQISSVNSLTQPDPARRLRRSIANEKYRILDEISGEPAFQTSSLALWKQIVERPPVISPTKMVGNPLTVTDQKKYFGIEQGAAHLITPPAAGIIREFAATIRSSLHALATMYDGLIETSGEGGLSAQELQKVVQANNFPVIINRRLQEARRHTEFKRDLAPLFHLLGGTVSDAQRMVDLKASGHISLEDLQVRRSQINLILNLLAAIEAMNISGTGESLPAPADPTRGGPSGSDTQIAVQGGAIETFISDVVPAVSRIFGRREPRIGPPLQNIKPDDSMKPANPPPAPAVSAVRLSGQANMNNGDRKQEQDSQRVLTAKAKIDILLQDSSASAANLVRGLEYAIVNFLDIPRHMLITDGRTNSLWHALNRGYLPPSPEEIDSLRDYLWKSLEQQEKFNNEIGDFSIHLKMIIDHLMDENHLVFVVEALRRLMGSDTTRQLLGEAAHGVAIARHIRGNGMHFLKFDRPVDNDLLVETVSLFIPLLLALPEHQWEQELVLHWNQEPRRVKFGNLMLWSLAEMLDIRLHDMIIFMGWDHTNAYKAWNVWPLGPDQAITQSLIRMVTDLDEVNSSGQKTGDKIPSQKVGVLLGKTFRNDAQWLQLGICPPGQTADDVPGVMRARLFRILEDLARPLPHAFFNLALAGYDRHSVFSPLREYEQKYGRPSDALKTFLKKTPELRDIATAA